RRNYFANSALSMSMTADYSHNIAFLELARLLRKLRNFFVSSLAEIFRFYGVLIPDTKRVIMGDNFYGNIIASKQTVSDNLSEFHIGTCDIIWSARQSYDIISVF